MSASSCLDNSNDCNGDAADFECNICLDLAQDPIVTLCGHLFCWPCIYKWLHSHSSSQNCPVCKVVIEEGKLVPLYGRGKNFSDPRSKSTPDVNIPHRPAAGKRQETTPPSYQDEWGMGGFSPLTSATSEGNTFQVSLGVFNCVIVCKFGYVLTQLFRSKKSLCKLFWLGYSLAELEYVSIFFKYLSVISCSATSMSRCLSKLQFQRLELPQ